MNNFFFNFHHLRLFIFYKFFFERQVHPLDILEYIISARIICGENSCIFHIIYEHACGNISDAKCEAREYLCKYYRKEFVW